MPLDLAHSFLVHPAKGEAVQPDISGTAVATDSRLFAMLGDVYRRSSVECDIDIVFQRAADGSQTNPCRDVVIAYARNPTLPHGRSLARRLQEVTTNRSKLGLLFLMKGTEGNQHRVVVSRFPADQGVVAEEHATRLDVEFIERIFMKSAKAYKSAIYSSDSFDGGFWHGRAVDRQISGPRELSDYWIQAFLLSELRTTGAAGTRRLATAWRNAIGTTSATPEVRHELMSATGILRGQDGHRQTTRRLVKALRLSDEAVALLTNGFPRPELMDEVFQFSVDEFRKHAPYRAVELDNGGMLIAEDDHFGDVFRREDLAGRQGLVRYTTEGKVVGEKLRKTK